MRSVYKQVIGSFIKCFPLGLSPQLFLQNVMKINLEKANKKTQTKENKKQPKTNQNQHPLHLRQETFFLWKGCFLANYKPTTIHWVKASTLGHMHFSLEIQQHSIQRESQTDTWVPLPALGGNSLLLETAEHVCGQEGAGRRGLVPGCHSLGVTTTLQFLERSWTERMRNVPTSLGEIGLMMPGAVICLSRNVATCSN